MGGLISTYYVCTYIQTYDIHTYVHIYIHTYIHMHIYTPEGLSGQQANWKSPAGPSQKSAP
jgi:hypothetical protein